MEVLIKYLRSLLQMNEDDLDILNTVAHTVIVPKHSFLLREGQVCDHVYFVAEGAIRMYYVDAQGNEINRRFTFEHNFATDLQSFTTRSPSSYYLQAMQPSELIAVKYHDLQAAYDKSKAWERLGRLLAEKGYQNLNERIELLQFNTPEERYLYVLNNKPELLQRIPLFYLASYLAIKPESLSRLRKRIGEGRT